MRRARSWVRLVTRIAPAPCWTRWRAASSLILPAPTRKTVRPCERTEDLAGQIDGDGGDGDGIGADAGFGAGFFGGGKGALQQMLELAGDGAGGAGDGEGLFYLAENLRLADDHGVEAGGHAEEMADGVLIAVFVDVRSEQRRRRSEVAA